MIENPVEHLMKVHPDLEVWWDSLPLVYDKWAQKMLDSAEPSQRSVLDEQLHRLYNTQDPAKSLIRGCTTNPPLSLSAIKSDPSTWNEWIDDLAQSNPDLDQKELAWLTYKEVVKRGAEMMMPIWQASKGRFGWISGQLDPRLLTETDVMIAQVEQLSALQPNVMIKVPGSTQGMNVLRALLPRASPPTPPSALLGVSLKN
jgi:transaldolase